MKLSSYVTVLLLLAALPIYAENFCQYDAQTYYSHDTIIDNNLNLYAPVKLSASGIKNFFHDVFNDRRYAAELLPHNFTHFIQFLEYGKKTKQQRAYFKLLMRLYTNKAKETPYIDASALNNQVLKEIPLLLGEYFLIFKAESDIIKELINELLYNSFLNKFSSFQANPNNFFNTLSDQIIQILDNNYSSTNEVSAEELRKTILIFLEVTLNKVIWHSSEQEKTWDSVKAIADNLSLLMEYNIIPDPDDLNDLFVTLIERYCFFIDIVENDLSVEFYEKVKSDITTNSISLFELEECDEFVEKKSQRLMRALVQGEAKARARIHNLSMKPHTN